MTPLDKREPELKSSDLLRSFTSYCLAHPHERFWQALRNWSGFPFIYACHGIDHSAHSRDLLDTFYWDTRTGR